MEAYWATHAPIVLFHLSSPGNVMWSLDNWSQHSSCNGIHCNIRNTLKCKGHLECLNISTWCNILASHHIWENTAAGGKTLTHSEKKLTYHANRTQAFLGSSKIGVAKHTYFLAELTSTAASVDCKLTDLHAPHLLSMKENRTRSSWHVVDIKMQLCTVSTSAQGSDAQYPGISILSSKQPPLKCSPAPLMCTSHQAGDAVVLHECVHPYQNPSMLP